MSNPKPVNTTAIIPEFIIVMIDEQWVPTTATQGWEHVLSLCTDDERNMLIQQIRQIAGGTNTTGMWCISTNVEKLTYRIALTNLKSEKTPWAIVLHKVDSSFIDSFAWITESKIPLLVVDERSTIRNVSKAFAEIAKTENTSIVGHLMDEFFPTWAIVKLTDQIAQPAGNHFQHADLLRLSSDPSSNWLVQNLADIDGLHLLLLSREQTERTEQFSHQFNRMTEIKQQVQRIQDAQNSKDMLKLLVNLSSQMLNGEKVALWIYPHFLRDNMVFPDNAFESDKRAFEDFCISNAFGTQMIEDGLDKPQLTMHQSKTSLSVDIIPIISLNRKIGGLLILKQTSSPEQKHDFHMQMVSLLIEMSSIPLLHTLEMEKLQTDYDRKTKLLKLAERVAPLSNIQSMMREVVDSLCCLFDYENVLISEVDHLSRRLSSPVYKCKLPRSNESKHIPIGIIAWVVENGDLLNIHDVLLDDRYVAGFEGTRSELAVPIQAADGQIVAVIDLQSDQINAFKETDEELLRSVALHVSTAMQNMQLFGVVNENLEEAHALLQISSLLSTTITVDDALRVICKGWETLLKATDVFYLSKQEHGFTVMYSTKAIPENHSGVAHLPADIEALLIEKHEPLRLIIEEQRNWLEPLGSLSGGVLVVIPMTYASDRLDGLVLCFIDAEICPVTVSTLRIFNHVSNSSLENSYLWEREKLTAQSLNLLNDISRQALAADSLEQFIQYITSYLGMEMNLTEIRIYLCYTENAPRLFKQFNPLISSELEQLLNMTLHKAIESNEESAFEWRGQGKLYHINHMILKDGPVWGHLQIVREAGKSVNINQDTGLANLKDILTSTRRRMTMLEKQTRLLGELQNSQKLRNEFLAKLSHELRTPLTTIMAYADMLTTGVLGELGNEQSRATGAIERSSRRLFQLITDLLDFSQMERDSNFSLSIAPTQLSSVVEDSVNQMLLQAREKRISIQNEVSKELPKVLADNGRLVQVINNLISNAIKFSEPGSVVTLRAYVKDDFVECEVEDEGIGINAEDQQRIFDAFVQLEDPLHREHGGTGLGLSIVQNLVTMMGGEVSVESQTAKGSIFRFTLPLVGTR